jgi:hypothetical protein
MDHSKALYGVEARIHETEIFLGVFVGAVTFTGSVIAFGKLQGLIGSKPLLMPGRHLMNLIAVLGCVYLGYLFVFHGEYFAPVWPLYVVTAVAFLLGIHLVMAIGGADMPVVVSMLNSYSGWAAAAAGFMLENDLLIITGALVGSSGAILSYIMCHAMNRSFLSVILGGFGADEGAAPGGAAAQPAGEVKAVTAEETADLLRDAKSVVIVPGYGMAVAQAQYPLYEVTKPLRDPSSRGPAARPHERAAGRGEGAVRHRARDGRDQQRFQGDRRRHRDRRQRHRQSGRARRSVFTDLRDADPRSVEGKDVRRHEARHGERLCRRRQSAVLQGEHTDAVRRCEEDDRRGPHRSQELAADLN